MAIAARTARRVLKTVIDAQYLADNVIFSNNDLIAINKPYGLPVHGGPGVVLSVAELLEEFAAIKNYQNKPELAHRLDKDCSGVLLLTRNKTAAQKIAEMFQSRMVKKRYLAVSVGVPRYEEGTISIPVGYGRVGPWERIIIRQDLVGKTHKEITEAGFKQAITKFKILDENQSTCSLLEIEPITGHKQQIRVHLADALRCPILGDHKFSSDKPQPQVIPLRLLQLLQISGVKGVDGKKGRIRPWQRGQIPLHLHSHQLVLPKYHTGSDLVISAPLPKYYLDTLSRLNLHPKRKKMNQSREEEEYYRLKRLGKSTKKIVGF
ncbi:pseudouridylate synthase RPUSD4, mitochondrial [Nematostella vectensis]|uniref:pseudouridylate synthase RPUSD4, mitochondrial n=1 Tax=Nematostella vectensis TaxID=45351 RepID=UPI00139043C0|nr:pseudouridylate synthase RPUSD4, mitochondrial [Nematostella vectensis]